jgi:glycine/D-amino acid oxidase-like deaminating enzyme
MLQQRSYDVVVVGGGVVGLSVARGVAAAGQRVAVLDEGDAAPRASRANFALVWVQSKGLGMPAYGAWTRASAARWPAFAAALREETGIDIGLRQNGGYALCLSEAEMEARRTTMLRMHAQPGWEPLEWEMQDHARVARSLPAIGPEVAGGLFCTLDGDLNVLRLYRALHASVVLRGIAYHHRSAVSSIVPLPGGGFRIATPDLEVEAARVVLAAGLGNVALAPMVGLDAPLRGQRGQLMVTEKVEPFLPHPVGTIRQTDEGGVMIGDSKEEGAVDDRTRPGVLAAEARRAVRMFPCLANVNVVRSWAAMRVMSRDGFPIYDASETAPGAFVIACHSGVTLAPVHSDVLGPMIADGALRQDMAVFGTRRFHVPAAA